MLQDGNDSIPSAAGKGVQPCQARDQYKLLLRPELDQAWLKCQPDSVSSAAQWSTSSCSQVVERVGQGLHALSL